MVIRKMLPLWVWGVLSVVFLGLAVGISAFYATWKVQTTVQNECSALEYIIKHPGPHISRTSVFYGDVKVWATRDGCS